MRIANFLLGIVGAAQLFLSNTAFAQTNLPPAKLPLWTVKGKSNTAHFLGSIHFGKREFYPLPAPIENAFKSSKIVVFETEMDRMTDPATVQKIGADATYPAGKTIADDISKETYALLHRTLAAKIGQATALDRFKPYLVAITVGGIEIQRLGFKPEDGVDQYILGKAKTGKKEVRALETIEKQMSFFTDMTKAEQETFLKSSLTEMNEFEETFGKIIAGWKKGDLAALEQLLLDEMKEHPELMKKLLIDRNKNWVPEFEKLLQGKEDVFVVVGAAHLVGKDNVIDLLKAKGFAVEQRMAR